MTEWHGCLRGRPDQATLEQWCVEYATTRDAALRDRILENFGWLINICARQMRRRGEPLDDLIQVGYVGLIEALDRFDPSFGVAFRTYASATITGVLRRHYRHTWRVYVPRRLQERHLEVTQAIDALTGRLQRSPTVDDLSNYLHIPAEDVLEAMEIGANFWPLPIEGGATDDDGRAASEETVGEPDPAYDVADDRGQIRDLLRRLPPRQRRILYMRFFDERTQSEIASAVGLSQVHVSRLMRSALATLRSGSPA